MSLLWYTILTLIHIPKEITVPSFPPRSFMPLTPICFVIFSQLPGHPLHREPLQRSPAEEDGAVPD